MALIRFPQEPEFNHPQHLWNEQEFIIRMLHQHKIGIGIIENNTQVTVTIQPGQSLNMIANGAVEFNKTNNNLAFTANTNRIGWIYIASDGSRFYLEPNLRPIYNQYLHGWYRNNGDRAVVFIDSEAPAGSRAILMDSFNAHFEHEQRIPMQGGLLYLAITNPNLWQNIILEPGSYRFEIRGGNGGRGGNGAPGNFPIFGGAGANGQVSVLRLNIYSRTFFNGILGGNGNNGENGRTLSTTNGPLIATGGGGAASGHDSRLLANNGSILLNAVGGSGGGGASAYPSFPFPGRARGTSSPGGGGAGNGVGGRGGNSREPVLYGAHGGNNNFGGSAGTNKLSTNGVSNAWGQSGQSRMGANVSLLIRRGGNSGNISGGGTTISASLGGTTPTTSSSGYFRIFQIRRFTGGEIA